jgi:hypothetical protein
LTLDRAHYYAQHAVTRNLSTLAAISVLAFVAAPAASADPVLPAPGSSCSYCNPEGTASGRITTPSGSTAALAIASPACAHDVCFEWRGGSYTADAGAHRIAFAWRDVQLGATWRRIGGRDREAKPYNRVMTGTRVSPRLKPGTYVLTVLFNPCFPAEPGQGCIAILYTYTYRLRVG